MIRYIWLKFNFRSKILQSQRNRKIFLIYHETKQITPKVKDKME